MKHFLLFSLLLIHFAAVSQPSWLWSKCPDTGARSEIHTIAHTSKNEIVVAGTFSNALSLGGVTLHGAGMDIFLAKFSPSGNLIWSQTFSGPYVDEFSTIAVDENDNIVIAGLAGGPSLKYGNTIIGNSGMFVARVDAAGSLKWMKRYKGAFKPGGIATGSNGMIALSAQFYDTLTVPLGNYISRGGYDLCVMALDTAGSEQWIRTYGGNRNDIAGGIAIADNGNIIFAAEWNSDTLSTGHSDFIVSDRQNDDLLLMAFSPNGSEEWAHAWPADGEGYTPQVTLIDTNIYLGASFSIKTFTAGNVIVQNQSSSFPGPGSNALLLKLNSKGIPVWGRSVASNHNVITALTANDMGIVAAGYGLSQPTTFGPVSFTRSVNGGWNFFVAQYDPAGNLQWVRFEGYTTDSNIATCVTSDHNNEICVAGWFNLPLALGSTTLQNNGMLLAKLGAPNPSGIGESTKSRAAFYPNPVFDELHVISDGGNLEILDLTGQRAASMLITAGDSKVTLALAPGIYVAQFKAPTGEMTREKFIVSR